MASWKSFAKGSAIFIFGVIVGSAGHSSPQSSIKPTNSPNSAVLAANTKAKAATPTPTPTSTTAPTPTATPKAAAIIKPAAKTTSTPRATIPTQAPVASSCSPNYSGCVPVASDVDCLGGSGNGPAYVKGPVKVLGADIYGLDSNHDGYGCE